MSRSRLELRPALFLDRDGTLIADAHFLADAARVALLPDAVAAVRRANALDVPVVIVTNQSGIARGLITDAQYAAVRDRTVALLAAEGATILATFIVPTLPPHRRPAIAANRGSVCISARRMPSGSISHNLPTSVIAGAMCSRPSRLVALAFSCPESKHHLPMSRPLGHRQPHAFSLLIVCSKRSRLPSRASGR